MAREKKSAQDERAAAIEQAIVQQVKSLALAPEPVRPPAQPSNPLPMLTVLVGLAAVFVLVRRIRAWLNEPDFVTALMQDRCSPEFLASFEQLARSIALESAPRPGTGKPPAGSAGEADVAPGESTKDPRGRIVDRIGKLIDELEAGTHQMLQLDLIGELCGESSALMNASSGREFLPLWQMSSALDAFLKQTFRKQSTVTRELIRTLADAHEVLQALCKSKVSPELTVQPPIRLLAVDDNEVCRLAIELAVTKALHEPDLAEDGATSLELAKSQKYDVVFADVEMPGMSGFELCSKLRQTEMNATTPVMFVTVHADSESHVKGAAAGGNGFLTKPFGILELSLKALTLVVAHRLHLPAALEAPRKEAGVETASAAAPANAQVATAATPISAPKATPVNAPAVA